MLNEIKSGGPSALSMAELPDEYLPQLKSVEAEGYTAVNFPAFSFAFFPLNMGNPIFGPVFSQLYFRQAFEHLVDQKGWVDQILDGYAVPTYGPVPTAPPNSFADSYESSDPYPVQHFRRCQPPQSARLGRRGLGQGGLLRQAGYWGGRVRGGGPRGPQARVRHLTTRAVR